MTEVVQAQMIGCVSSTQLWSRVTHLFAMRSKAKVMQYKLHIQTLKKGSLSMKDYLGKMKHYMDVLAACGHPLSDDDQVLYILAGVGLEYDSVVVHVTSKIESLSISEVGALLLAHEARIESYNSDVASPSINVATFPKRYASPPQNSRGRGRGRNGRGGRRGWNNSSGRPICQICFTPGHMAHKCYYRFDKEFVTHQQQFGRNSSPQQGNGRAYSQRTNQYHAASLATAQQESTPCTFLGYSNKHKGYKCITQDGRLYISRHVRFDEHSFPFAQKYALQDHSAPQSSSSSILYLPQTFSEATRLTEIFSFK
ncbi:hypothetical protein F511_11183 [Dorcoceras hygrometricum]|uniref:Retroviral polymerase SH3-like domain-containing protein n=1 Tax=Dorcoceras hygrometricum TaxID=472368 RepID=A0A2Z7B489_9LAMI|nr:hypothetical protein F511_11183 [Dorcoceras hygrometricum]